MYYRKTSSGRVISREVLRPRIRVNSVEEIRKCLGRVQTAVVQGIYGSTTIIANPNTRKVLDALASHIGRALLYDASITIVLLATNRRLVLASSPLAHLDGLGRKSNARFERGEWMFGNHKKRLESAEKI